MPLSTELGIAAGTKALKRLVSQTSNRGDLLLLAGLTAQQIGAAYREAEGRAIADIEQDVISLIVRAIPITKDLTADDRQKILSVVTGWALAWEQISKRP